MFIIGPINPFGTAVPFGDKTTWNLTCLSPERDCGSKRVIDSTYHSAPKYGGRFGLISICKSLMYMGETQSSRTQVCINHFLEWVGELPLTPLEPQSRKPF